MAGNSTGGQKAYKKNIERHGKDFYQRIGSLGGRTKGPKGFAVMPKDKVRAAGRNGGIKSRRGKAKVTA